MQQWFTLTLLFVVFLTNSSAQEAENDRVKTPIDNLREYFALAPKGRPELSRASFAKIPLTKSQAEAAVRMILKDRLATLRVERKKEFDAKMIMFGDKTMKYDYRIYGDEPEGGHSLYISMHGGGGAPARVNDQQWRNQIRLYQPKEGIYLAPRAPTDTWNLWHQKHIDPMFDRLIENFIAIKGVNPNKVYVMGYSAGGDGAYQLAPRMADRWAGAAMMAGHPGDAQFWNLRNLAYIIQCGGKDRAYNRANLCAQWGNKLKRLSQLDPPHYVHKCVVYPQYGHWMNLECKQAVPWMAKYTRNPWPKKLHWYQDNVTHNRFYWLSNKNPKHRQLISAAVKEQTIILNTPDIKLDYYHPAMQAMGFKDKAKKFGQISKVTLRLADQLIDMNHKVTVKDARGMILLEKKIVRTIATIAESLEQRPDGASVAYATLEVTLPK